MSSPPPNAITDPIALFVLGGTILFSPEVAAVMGPYLAVFAASTVGGGFALARRKKTSRRAALWFFARVCGASILLTGMIAAAIVGAHPSFTERAMLIPVAFAIGLIGDDWGNLAVAAWGKVDLIYSALKGGKQ